MFIAIKILTAWILNGSSNQHWLEGASSMSYIVCKCVPWALRPPGPNRPPWFLPFHFHSSFTPSDMAFFCRYLPTRLVPGLPRRRPWIGTPSRPHLPSPIVQFGSAFGYMEQRHIYRTRQQKWLQPRFGDFQSHGGCQKQGRGREEKIVGWTP